MIDDSPSFGLVIDDLHFETVPRAGDTINTPTGAHYDVIRVAHYPGHRAAAATFSIMLAAERTPDRG